MADINTYRLNQMAQGQQMSDMALRQLMMQNAQAILSNPGASPEMTAWAEDQMQQAIAGPSDMRTPPTPFGWSLVPNKYGQMATRQGPYSQGVNSQALINSGTLSPEWWGEVQRRNNPHVNQIYTDWENRQAEVANYMRQLDRAASAPVTKNAAGETIFSPNTAQIQQQRNDYLDSMPAWALHDLGYAMKKNPAGGWNRE